MRRDIDEALHNWPYEPERGGIAVREVRARDGRAVLQIRIELGLLQLEVNGRPDGQQPHGHPTYLDYLKRKAKSANSKNADVKWVLSPEHFEQVDREFIQYYHRRIAWLTLQRYRDALKDAEHTLALMDFVVDFSDSKEYVESHERFRALVIFHRAQAKAAIALEDHDPANAVEAIHEGMEQIAQVQRAFADNVDGHDHDLDQDREYSYQVLVEQLQKLEKEIRKNFKVPKTLDEQLAEAVAREDYETAAWIRDQIRSKRAKHHLDDFH